MRVYISGGITGVTDFEQRFAQAEQYLLKCGFQPINPAKVNMIMPNDTTYDQYMIVDLAMLSTADAIYMLDDWHKSRGATQEFQYAVQSNKIIYFENESRHFLINVETGKRVEFIEQSQDPDYFIGRDIESGWVHANWMKDCFITEKGSELI